MAINYKNQGYDLATTALTTVLTISTSTVAIIKEISVTNDDNSAHEVDSVGNKTTIAAFIRSGDYDISEQGLGGDGQLIMRVKRFIPDFKNLEGNAKITLFFRDYPADASSTPSTTPPTITGPFTITSSTDKVDTRVRGRQVSLKIENDAIDQSWRYGTLRLDIEAGGRR